MEALVAAVEGTVETHQLQSTPQMLFATAGKLAPLLLGATVTTPEAQVKLLVDALNKVKTAIASNETLPEALLCCSAAFLSTLAETAPDASVIAQPEQLLIEVLLGVLCRTPAVPRELECATLCLARLYPKCGKAAVDKCIEAISSAAGSDNLAVETGVDVLGHVADQLILVDSHLDEKVRLIEAAFVSVALTHREATTVPLVIRRVLIPLLRSDDELRARYREPVLAQVRTFADTNDRLPEAIVLLAALFDFFFPAAVKKEDDLRYDSTLWTIVLDSLKSVTKFNEDPSKRATLHLHVIYLLKRIVEYTAANCTTTSATPPPAGKGGKGGKKGKGGAAAKVVLAEPIVFHPNFVWYGTETEQHWQNFFLIFETLNEFGVHLINPIMPKLEALCVACQDRFPSAWVEILMHKAVLHSNVGARRVGLGFLWSLNPAVVRGCNFSSTFLFETALLSAADAKLCTEVDRAVLPGSFLDCKAFGGNEEQNLPTILPVVLTLEQFYTDILQDEMKRYESDEAAQKKALGDCFLRILQAVKSMRCTRFTITVILRLVGTLASKIQLPLLSAPILQLLTQLSKEIIHDRHPNWLEGRMLALLLEIAFNLCCNQAGVFGTEEFAEFVSSLGKGGSAGGKAFAAFDSSGVVGLTGTCLPREALYGRLAQLAESNSEFAAVIARSWADFDALCSGSQRGSLTASAAKRATIFLPFAPKTGRQSLAAELEDLPARTNMSLSTRLGTLLLFAECGEPNGDQLLWDEPALKGLWESLRSTTNQTLREASVVLRNDDAVQTVDDLQREAWDIHVTDRWDIVCAATTRCVQQLAQTHQKNLKYGLTEMKLAHEIRSVIEDHIVPLASLNVVKTPAREYGRLIALRNAVRYLQALSTAHATGHLSFADVFTAEEAQGLIEKLMAVPSLHLKVAATPCCLSTESWGVVIGQAYRGQWNTIFALTAAMETLPQDIATRWMDTCLEELDRCSSANMSCVVDLMGWLSPRVSDKVLSESLSVVHRQVRNAAKRDQLRIVSTYLLMMTQHPGCEDVATDIIDEFLSTMDDCETTERNTYLLSVACALSELQPAQLNSEVGGPFMFAVRQLAIFTVTSYQEDENEACLAAAEPALMCWPDSLRRELIPTLRMTAVARSLAITTLLQRAKTHPKFALQLMKDLLEANFSNETISHEPCMPNSKTHRARIHIWQIILSLASIIRPEEWTEVADAVIRCLCINNMGSVRRYMELVMIKAVWDMPSLCTKVVEEVKNPEWKTQATGSFALVVVQLVMEKGFDPKIGAELMAAVFPELIRLSASHQHLLRLIAQIAVHELFCLTIKVGKPLPGVTVTAELMALFEFLDTNPEAIKARGKNVSVVIFDAKECLTPRDIYCVQRKESEFWLLESVPAAVFDRIRFIEGELISALGCTTPFELYRCRQLVRGRGFTEAFGATATLDAIPHTKNHYEMFLDYSVELKGGQLANQASSVATAGSDDNVQRKVQSWWASEAHNELHPRALGIRKRQSVIIVTSLLDNPVNVAGLCRCSEIWTVEKVVVSDKKVFAHPHFVAVARSAELWTPYEVVPPAGLAPYLTRMRSEGYTIVGIEQTSTSQRLSSFKYPERSVIVLGSEGQGMPASIIPVMDVCVEIPQYGLIRSLNVHVTGAVALYEYTRQMLMLPEDAAIEQQAGADE